MVKVVVKNNKPSKSKAHAQKIMDFRIAVSFIQHLFIVFLFWAKKIFQNFFGLMKFTVSFSFHDLFKSLKMKSLCSFIL